jgi:hypothetical protein
VTASSNGALAATVAYEIAWCGARALAVFEGGLGLQRSQEELDNPLDIVAEGRSAPREPRREGVGTMRLRN